MHGKGITLQFSGKWFECQEVDTRNSKRKVERDRVPSYPISLRLVDSRGQTCPFEPARRHSKTWVSRMFRRYWIAPWGVRLPARAEAQLPDNVGDQANSEAAGGLPVQGKDRTESWQRSQPREVLPFRGWEGCREVRNGEDAQELTDWADCTGGAVKVWVLRGYCRKEDVRKK